MHIIFTTSIHCILQTNVYYFKDKEHKISLDNIEKVDYITLCFNINGNWHIYNGWDA